MPAPLLGKELQRWRVLVALAAFYNLRKPTIGKLIRKLDPIDPRFGALLRSVDPDDDDDIQDIQVEAARVIFFAIADILDLEAFRRPRRKLRTAAELSLLTGALDDACRPGETYEHAIERTRQAYEAVQRKVRVRVKLRAGSGKKR